MIFCLKFSEQRYNAAKNCYLIGIDRIHRPIFRLQTNPMILIENALDRRLIFDHRDDNLSVDSRRLPPYNDDVSVQNTCLNHAFTLNAQRKNILSSNHILRQYDLIFDILLGQNGDTLTREIGPRAGFLKRFIWLCWVLVTALGSF